MASKNKNNQSYFVVRASAFPEGQADGGFALACDRTGKPDSDGTWRRVRFGARVSELIAGLPAKERDSVVVLSVLAARKNRENGQGTRAGLVDMLAFEAREADQVTREIADAVVEKRARLRNPATRKSVAKAILAGE